MMSKSLCVISHGADSAPHIEELVLLSEIAQYCGYETYLPDYRECVSFDDRVAHLLVQEFGVASNLCLAGVGVGAQVSLVAAKSLMPTRLFLLSVDLGEPYYKAQEQGLEGIKMSFLEWRTQGQQVKQSTVDFAGLCRADFHLFRDKQQFEKNCFSLSGIFSRFLT